MSDDKWIDELEELILSYDPDRYDSLKGWRYLTTSTRVVYVNEDSTLVLKAEDLFDDQNAAEYHFWKLLPISLRPFFAETLALLKTEYYSFVVQRFIIGKVANHEATKNIYEAILSLLGIEYSGSPVNVLTDCYGDQVVTAKDGASTVVDYGYLLHDYQVQKALKIDDSLLTSINN